VLSDLEVMHLHVDAEFRHDAAGCLVSTNEPAALPAPRFFFGHASDGIVDRYRGDVSAVRRSALRAAIVAATRGARASAVDEPLDPTPFEQILSLDAPIQHTSVGLAFRFTRPADPVQGARILRKSEDASLLHPLLAAWAPDIHASAPLVAFVLNGQAVAICASVRIAPRAHEAGVETAAPFRGRGYARAAVAAWSASVRALDAEPLYSTTWQNTASRALARSLGLVVVGRDLHIT
jgi:RimJ/RimL family protein N-acetyltransferase